MEMRVRATDGLMPEDEKKIRDTRSSGDRIRVLLDVSEAEEELIGLVEAEIREVLDRHGFSKGSGLIERS